MPDPIVTTTTLPAPTAVEPKDRIRAIMNLPEAQGRDATAKSLALDTNLTVDEAKAVLATMPKAGGTLAERMAGEPQPNLGVGGVTAEAKPGAVDAKDLDAGAIYARRAEQIARIAQR